MPPPETATGCSSCPAVRHLLAVLMTEPLAELSLTAPYFPSLLGSNPSSGPTHLLPKLTLNPITSHHGTPPPQHSPALRWSLPPGQPASPPRPPTCILQSVGSFRNMGQPCRCDNNHSHPGLSHRSDLRLALLPFALYAQTHWPPHSSWSLPSSFKLCISGSLFPECCSPRLQWETGSHVPLVIQGCS